MCTHTHICLCSCKFVKLFIFIDFFAVVFSFSDFYALSHGMMGVLRCTSCLRLDSVIFRRHKNMLESSSRFAKRYTPLVYNLLGIFDCFLKFRSEASPCSLKI